MRLSRASAGVDKAATPRRTGSSEGPTGVVQRIQRFGKFTEFKRGALESIARRCMRQTKEYSQSLDGPGAPEAPPAAAALQPDDTQRLVVGPRAAPTAVAAAAAIGGEKVRAKVKGGASLKQAKGLLEHMMVSGGTVRLRTLWTRKPIACHTHGDRCNEPPAPRMEPCACISCFSLVDLRRHGPPVA